MNNGYTNEKNVLILIALLKHHGIKHVIASPGTTNAALIRSLQIDTFFKIYSVVDERSAAYVACGMCEELGQPVIISCTGATASRNYLSGLTEAFYKKLPILAITSSRDKSRYGHLEDQVIDRTSRQTDVVKHSVHLPNIKDIHDEWECSLKVNEAIMELGSRGGGPVHINLSTTYSRNYTIKSLPDARPIHQISLNDEMPVLPNAKIGIYVGSHPHMSEQLAEKIDRFCESYNAIVLIDHTSGYRGKYGIQHSLVLTQRNYSFEHLLPEIIIHLGEISGFYQPFVGKPNMVWRISEDGCFRDTFYRLRYLFCMNAERFFENYISEQVNETSYYDQWKALITDIYLKCPELPFSNVWAAQQLAPKIPANSNLQFGILNSLSSWNYFEVPHSVKTNSNVGGYGIDGCTSTMLGASLVDPNKLNFLIIGDLAFFYDLNCLGNRHLQPNLRILLVNNGKGMEFKIKNNPAAQFGADTDEFIAAAGHFGNQSKKLVRSFSQALNFKYLSATNKSELLAVIDDFLNSEVGNQPVILEIFTNEESEDLAHKMLRGCLEGTKGKLKEALRSKIGDKSVNSFKGMLGK